MVRFNGIVIEILMGAGRRIYLKSESFEIPRDRNQPFFILFVYADKHRPFSRQPDARRKLGLRESAAETIGDSHHFAGRFHFRAQNGIHSGKFVERKNR